MRAGVCNQNEPEFYWGIKGNELCVLCAPSVYLISMQGFLPWLNMDRGKLITLQNGGMKCLSALPGGRAVFALPECVRAAVGTAGAELDTAAPADSASSFRPSPPVACWGFRVGSSRTQAEGHWVQGLAPVHALTTQTHTRCLCIILTSFR